MTVDITTKCNLKCRYCFIIGNRRTRSTDPTLYNITKIIDNFRVLDGKFLTLSGGEPLLRSDIDDIINYALSQGLHLTILTNGTILDKWIMSRRRQYLLDNKCVNIQISLDGSKPQINDILRGKGSFKSVIKSIYITKKLGYVDRLSIAVTLTRKNISDISNIVDLIASFGVPSITFTFLHNLSSKSLNIELLKPSSCETFSALVLLYTLRNKFKNKLVIRGEIFEDIENRICNYALLSDFCDIGNTIKVTTTGDIFPCPYFYAQKYVLGNVYKKPFDLMITLKKLAKFRKLILQRREKIEKCRQCFWSYCCGGGCVADAFSKYGTIWREDSLCDARKMFYERFIVDLCKSSNRMRTCSVNWK